MNNIVIYTGLSICFDEAKSILDADYQPPIKRGDIDNLLNNRDDMEIIGIIDGVFHQSPAVSHKEILRALKDNITVVGGASMGALRACELYPYGMIGIGNIFEDYKNGTIESDDDVAVSLDPTTYEQLSDSWINMKYNFNKAQKDNILSQEDVDNLLATSKDIYYPKRSFEYVIKKSELTEYKKTELTKYLDKNKFDIKHDDAKAVIEYIKTLV
ncbi:MAG: TfuA-related McrA-glycine thioamidation protein [Methanosphaera stadtmanae]|nr:TfuA-related McrA-glycine thioamidation protein [Methanosphaera stadtmanae]